MDMITTAPRIPEYSASAPPDPVYCAMVGARMVAITITLADLSRNSRVSNSDCNYCSDDFAHVCHIGSLLSVASFPCIGIDGQDDQSEDTTDDSNTNELTPLVSIASQSFEIDHDIGSNRSQEASDQYDAYGNREDRKHYCVY